MSKEKRIDNNTTVVAQEEGQEMNTPVSPHLDVLETSDIHVSESPLDRVEVAFSTDLVVELGGYAVKMSEDKSIAIEDDRPYATRFVRPEKFELTGRQGAFVDVNFQLPVKSDSTQTSIAVPYGVVAILGGAGSGKSEFLAKLVQFLGEDRFEYIRFMEPEAPCITDPYEMLHRLGAFLLGDKRYCGLDSSRYMVFNPGRKAATGTGGMNMSLFSSLTALSVAAELRQKTIFVIINPVTANPDTMKLYVEALNGSVNGVMTMIARGRFEWVARTEENDRRKQTFDVGITHEGLKQLKASLDEKRKPMVDVDTNNDILSSYLNLGLTTRNNLK